MGSSEPWWKRAIKRMRQGLGSLAGTGVDTPFPRAFLQDVAPEVVRKWESRSAFDRAHMHSVAVDLVDRDVARDVVIAGLLHDIGKPDRVSTAARTVLVILNRIGPNVATWLIRGKVAFPGRDHLRALADHAEIGAAFLNRHKVSERIVWLVRYHHHVDVDDEGLLELQSADDRH